MRRPTTIMTITLLVLLAACTAEPEEPAVEPDHVLLDHILIGVAQLRLPNVKRTSAEARELAFRVFHELRAGADWNEFRKRYSDDKSSKGPGGPYWMANEGVAPRRKLAEQPRERAAKDFADIGFGLEIGEIGIAEYHPRSCPFGFHIIKRLE